MKPAPCHPERMHVAKGMCSVCYWAWRYRTDKAFRESKLEYRRRYDAETKADPVAYAEYLAYHRERNRRTRERALAQNKSTAAGK